jgi:hypothetical protein
VYSYGILLWELATGSKAFAGAQHAVGAGGSGELVVSKELTAFNCLRCAAVDIL